MRELAPLLSNLRQKRRTSRHAFKARTTGVSNPFRSPSFRASASVNFQEVAFAIGIPFFINAFYRYKERSTSLKETPRLVVLHPTSR